MWFNLPHQIAHTIFMTFLMEIAVSGFNFGVLMNMVYQPRFGELVAHQIGMYTRIIYIFPFAYLMIKMGDIADLHTCLICGFYWLLYILAFEWGGSCIMRRSVHDILIGWHIENGYR